MTYLLERVLDLLAGLLEVALRLVGLALGLQPLVAGRLSGGVLGLARELLRLVLDLVYPAHRASLLVVFSALPAAFSRSFPGAGPVHTGSVGRAAPSPFRRHRTVRHGTPRAGMSDGMAPFVVEKRPRLAPGLARPVTPWTDRSEAQCPYRPSSSPPPSCPSRRSSATRAI